MSQTGLQPYEISQDDEPLTFVRQSVMLRWTVLGQQTQFNCWQALRFAVPISSKGACTKVVPFLVEDELLSLGATFSKVKNWGVHVVTDGLLITGQNPASSDRQGPDRRP